MAEKKQKTLFQVDIFLPIVHNTSKLKGLLTLGTIVQAEQVAGWKKGLPLLLCAPGI
jgi:hypothetical protein